MLGTGPGSFPRTSSALNPRAVSPSPSLGASFSLSLLSGRHSWPVIRCLDTLGNPSFLRASWSRCSLNSWEAMVRTGASCLELCEQSAVGFTRCATLSKLHTLSVYYQCHLPSRLSREGGLKCLGWSWFPGTSPTAAFPPEDGDDNSVAVGERGQCGTDYLSLAGSLRVRPTNQSCWSRTCGLLRDKGPAALSLAADRASGCAPDGQ